MRKKFPSYVITLPQTIVPGRMPPMERGWRRWRGRIMAMYMTVLRRVRSFC